MRTHLAPLALAAVWLSGCGDPSAPAINLRIVAATAGVDDDPDGYVAFVGSQFRANIPADGIRVFALDPGTYEVRIDGLAANCAMRGPASASVTIQPGLPAEVVFTVDCRAVTGLIEVRAPTVGEDYPPAGFSFYVTDPTAATWLSSVPVNGAAVVPLLPAGSYQLRFAPAGNCAVTGEDTRTVSVTTGGLTRDTARVEFAVTCLRVTGDVQLHVTTTGVAPDPDGYMVKLDGVLVEVVDLFDYYGVAPLRLSPNDGHFFARLAPGDHTIELLELAGNCAADGPNPRTVSVSSGVVSDFAIGVVCGAP